MSIICAICHKKQSGWIEDYPLSEEHTNQRICYMCHGVLQTILADEDEQEVADALAHVNKYISGDVAPEVKAVLEKTVEQREKKREEAERRKQEAERIEKEKREQEELARIAQEDDLRQNRERHFQVRLDKLKATGAEGYYEYKVISLLDESGIFRSGSGKVNTVAMAETLNDLGLDGWHLVTAYSNELGKNALSGGYGGAVFGTNSTIDENILIFERFVRF